MSAQRRTVLALVASFATLQATPATRVTPVEKVITLLEGLKQEVETEGVAEASSYDTFACFCKSQTSTLSGTITSNADDIDTFSADVEAKTASEESKRATLTERKEKQQKLNADLAAAKARHAAEKAEYEATAADLSKAISSLDNAKQALGASTPASFLAIQGSLRKTLALADALSLPSSKTKAVSILSQQGVKVDPNNPEFQFHSQGIMEMLEGLHTEFTDSKTKLDNEWGTTSTANENGIDAIGGPSGQIATNDAAIALLESELDNLKTQIASTRGDLVSSQNGLKDDQQYLKDLTQRCEIRAKDWDQRSQLRSDELTALAEALTVLTDKVQSKDEAVNSRVLLQKPVDKQASAVQASPPVKSNTEAEGQGHMSKPTAPSFLQGSSAKGSSKTFLERRVDTVSKERTDKAVAALQEAGLRLKSTAISALAGRLSTDPFIKVKGLIQKLIERLLAEAKAETTKTSFCNERLGKSKKTRDYRFAEATKLSVEMGALAAKKDELTLQKSTLTSQISALQAALEQNTDDRNAERIQNAATLSDAKDGLVAISEAISIMKVFYKNAAKATVLVQASPVDEATEGAGFKGAYKGKQDSATGIIGMLEVIKTDFERTVRITKEEEASAHAEFVKFERTSKSSISGKTTKKELVIEDLDTATTTLTEKKQSLTTAMNLVDDALQEIEALRPTCIDTGMDYSDRVANREAEIEALKTALCQLDPDGVESECGGM